jgi:hypothetical protein
MIELAKPVGREAATALIILEEAEGEGGTISKKDIEGERR